MNRERLVTFFATNPAVRLLRSPHAAQIACFVHEQFKADRPVTIPHGELAQRLGDYLDRLHATDPECLSDRPENYLSHWTSPECRWLRRYHDADHAEPVYELTPHTEEVLKFLDHMLGQGAGFVGTESRLKRIIDALSDIVVRGSDDPERRLAHLRAQRDEIDREIADIESGVSVKTYTATAIRERFADAVADLTSLQGDFRAVEESFKAITRDVQQRQAQASGQRGEILGYVLEAEDRLKTDDQGVSFHEFVRLVLSPVKQDQLEAMVEQLSQIEALAAQSGGMQRIRGMVSHLAEEAEKVLRTTRRLSSTLRRLLDARSSVARQRISTVLRDIKAAARQLADAPPTDVAGLQIEVQHGLTNPFERTFWIPPSEFDVGDLAEHRPDELDRFAAFRHFAELERLDWTEMRDHVNRLIEGDDNRVTLQEVVDAFPLPVGAIELLGYLQLAHDEGHEVDALTTEVIEIATAEGRRARYELPRVEFVSQPANRTSRPTAMGATDA